MAGPLAGLVPSLTRDDARLRALSSGAIALLFASYLLALRYSTRLRARWVIAAIVAVQAILLCAPPLFSTDVFNYLNYGRMGVVHGLNPYTTAPLLEPHGDPTFAISNWHHLLSPYGPLFTLLTYALSPLGVGASFWTVKVIIALASLATLALVWRCAALLGRPRRAAIVLVGLNPACPRVGPRSRPQRRADDAARDGRGVPGAAGVPGPRSARPAPERSSARTRARAAARDRPGRSPRRGIGRGARHRDRRQGVGGHPAAGAPPRRPLARQAGRRARRGVRARGRRAIWLSAPTSRISPPRAGSSRRSASPTSSACCSASAGRPPGCTPRSR